MKNKIIFGSIILLAGAVIIAQFVGKDNFLYALNFNKENSTLNTELSDFAVKNPEIIDKIFLSDKLNNKVLLEKTEEGWRVNQQFYAREDAIKNLFDAIEKIRVKSPISRAEHNTQVKRLSVEAHKIELYSKGEKLKTYYIGGSTQDQKGTYALIEGSSVPFVVHIPGFLGFLTPRFITTESLWRENFIFKADPKKIDLVSVENHEDSSKSFILQKTDLGYQLLDYENKPIKNIDTLQVKYYLSNLKRVSYEAIVVSMNQEKKDSLVQSMPFYTITFKAGDNNKQTIKTYHVPNDTHYDDNGNLLKYDPDRMYGVFNGGKDWATVQFYSFDKIIVDPKLFIIQK
ncbi:MAG: DUF4340 domain-containing protein [Bacteroidales bacterium]|nr:DUF4340 domain-containing protein [Bacteroidales bacterium]